MEHKIEEKESDSTDTYIGRSAYDAPDVDGLVIEVSGVDIIDTFIARALRDIAQVALASRVIASAPTPEFTMRTL